MNELPPVRNYEDLRKLAIKHPKLLIAYAFKEEEGLGLRSGAVDTFPYLEDKELATSACIRAFDTGDMTLQEAALGALGYIETERALAFIQKVVDEALADALIVSIATEIATFHLIEE